MTQEFGCCGGGSIEIEVDPLYNRKEYIDGIMKLVGDFGYACVAGESTKHLIDRRDQIRIRIDELK